MMTAEQREDILKDINAMSPEELKRTEQALMQTLCHVAIRLYGKSNPQALPLADFQINRINFN
jgi:hypothetical protein